jgi:hypothetical protein
MYSAYTRIKERGQEKYTVGHGNKEQFIFLIRSCPREHGKRERDI